jgi:hypothetical protein
MAPPAPVTISVRPLSRMRSEINVSG